MVHGSGVTEAKVKEKNKSLQSRRLTIWKGIKYESNQQITALA